MKWLFQNAGQKLAFAWQHPGYSFRAVSRELTLADERFLGRVTGTSAGQIRRYLDEPAQTPAFAEHLRAVIADFHALSIQSADLFAKKVLLQYAAVRALAPDCVVETGIANGVSSSYLLLALQRNGRGRLHSVGLADPSYLPADRAPGWVVPAWLRGPWEVHLGDSREVLPRLLSDLGRLDVFIHDSLHTYEHMLWEFETAYPKLRPGGLLISDDALWNPAFPEFRQRVAARDAQILRGVGFLRKNLP
jgi:predicted O-methyltransferase YrrM